MLEIILEAFSYILVVCPNNEFSILYSSFQISADLAVNMCSEDFFSYFNISQNVLIWFYTIVFVKLFGQKLLECEFLF